MQEIRDLYELIISGKASAEEEQHFMQLMAAPENEETAKELLLSFIDRAEADESIPALSADRLSIIAQSIFIADPVYKPEPPIRWIHRPFFRYAAAIILLMGMATFFWITRDKKDPQTPAIADKDTLHITPGRNGAILTLADGSQVLLDSAANGIVASQNGAEAVLQNGQLSYNPTGNTNETMVYNTMRTPAGRQFEVTLPDGTHVWLNAASSIRFPTVFTGKERRVQITGEAYFEVTKIKAKPFIVQINDGLNVEVLGTKFNINSYADEGRINTTLLEGSVRVSHPQQSLVLKPGQQAQCKVLAPSSPGDITLGSNVDINLVMAWKNGKFNFQDADLRQVMKQIERWYDVQVVYEGKIPSFSFEGMMDRGVQITDVLRFLGNNGIKARLEGRQLIITE